jgi:30S ribosomal protein 3
MDSHQQLKLKVLWLKNILGLSIDQILVDHAYPVTQYYFWPKTEAWDQLKLELDSRPWLSEKDKIVVLNLTTDIVNYWHTSRKVEKLDSIKQKFTTVDFVEVNI